jgi:hypothetical protein
VVTVVSEPERLDGCTPSGCAVATVGGSVIGGGLFFAVALSTETEGGVVSVLFTGG